MCVGGALPSGAGSSADYADPSRVENYAHDNRSLLCAAGKGRRFSAYSCARLSTDARHRTPSAAPAAAHRQLRGRERTGTRRANLARYDTFISFYSKLACRADQTIEFTIFFLLNRRV